MMLCEPKVIKNPTHDVGSHPKTFIGKFERLLNNNHASFDDNCGEPVFPEEAKLGLLAVTMGVCDDLFNSI